MPILGIWVALIGYVVLYAGLANWQGSSLSIPQAFTGSGQVKCGGKSAQAGPPPSGKDPFAPAGPVDQPSGYNPQTGSFGPQGPPITGGAWITQ